MIKVAMVRLDTGPGDEFRLATADQLVRLFGCHLIGLFLNPLPKPAIAEEAVSAQLWGRQLEKAREAGDDEALRLTTKLGSIEKDCELHRFDVFPEDSVEICRHEARTADVFISLRFGRGDPPIEDSEIVENVLFGSGRHLFVATDKLPFEHGFENAIVAWNGSREAARAVSVSLPYLQKTRKVSVVVVGEKIRSGDQLAAYLRIHGCQANFHQASDRDNDAAATLLAEIRAQNADLVVMGAYGHSRLREWLLGGVTYEFLRSSPVSLVIAH
jgi:nucleotide-binding universal stress UspA family protein